MKIEGKKIAFPMLVFISSPILFIGEGVYHPFLSKVTVEAPIILHVPCQIQLQLCLSFSDDPISTHPGSILMLFPGCMSLVPLSMHFLLTL